MHFHDESVHTLSALHCCRSVDPRAGMQAGQPAFATFDSRQFDFQQLVACSAVTREMLLSCQHLHFRVKCGVSPGSSSVTPVYLAGCSKSPCTSVSVCYDLQPYSGDHKVSACTQYTSILTSECCVAPVAQAGRDAVNPRGR